MTEFYLLGVQQQTVCSLSNVLKNKKNKRKDGIAAF